MHSQIVDTLSVLPMVYAEAAGLAPQHSVASAATMLHPSSAFFGAPLLPFSLPQHHSPDVSQLLAVQHFEAPTAMRGGMQSSAPDNGPGGDQSRTHNEVVSPWRSVHGRSYNGSAAESERDVGALLRHCYVEPNIGRGDCYWLATAPLSGLDAASARRHVAAWAARSDHPSRRELARLRRSGAPTTTTQVNASVQAMPTAFPHGLLVWHEPSRAGVLFRPGAVPQVTTAQRA